ncbi:MAG TPA: ribonuclease P protein component [Cyclobacteriaceae bacterium]|nr:ribonuclease P protein component [Cyclobacteriaceae bacterium]
MGKFSLHKSSLLSKKKNIQELFNKGSSFTLYPLRVYYLAVPDEEKTQVLFTVAKKNFKKAVDRNRIKRLMREAYRLNRYEFEIPQKLHIAYIYIGNEILPFQIIEAKLKATLKKLMKDAASV